MNVCFYDINECNMLNADSPDTRFIAIFSDSKDSLAIRFNLHDNDSFHACLLRNVIKDIVENYDAAAHLMFAYLLCLQHPHSNDFNQKLAFAFGIMQALHPDIHWELQDIYFDLVKNANKK